MSIAAVNKSAIVTKNCVGMSDTCALGIAEFSQVHGDDSIHGWSAVHS
jgi:hypothetical protein